MIWKIMFTAFEITLIFNNLEIWIKILLKFISKLLKARAMLLSRKLWLYTKRVIVSHMSGIIDLRPHIYKAKCGALGTYYQISFILNVWYFIDCQIKKCEFWCSYCTFIWFSKKFFHWFLMLYFNSISFVKVLKYF